MTDLLTETAIQQLNLGYDSDQDRLLLKVGLPDHVEVAVWLTRRVVKSLWVLLQGKAHAAETSGHALVMVASSNLQELSVNSSMQEAFDNASQKPLAFSIVYEARTPLMEQPILVSSCELFTHDEGQSRLEMQAKDGKAIKMILNIELILALTNMLQLASKEAAWDLGFTAGHFMLPALNTRPVLH